MNPAQFEWQTRCEFNAYYKEEGLPFVLDYDVWHRKDAAANGMFDDEASPENRDWRDEHDGIIADTIAGILFKALPAHTIPPKLRFSYENVPALDVSSNPLRYQQSAESGTASQRAWYPG